MLDLKTLDSLGDEVTKVVTDYTTEHGTLIHITADLDGYEIKFDDQNKREKPERVLEKGTIHENYARLLEELKEIERLESLEKDEPQYH